MASFASAYVAIRADFRDLKKDFDQGFALASKQMDKLDQTGKAIARAFGVVDNEIKKTNASITNLGKGLDRAYGSVRNFVYAFGGLYAIKNVAKSFLDAAVFLDQTNKTLQAVTGSALEASRSFDYIRTASEKLGLSFKSQVENFTQLTAASKGTKLEGEAVKAVWLGLSQATTALQLSNERAGNAVYALVQMMSKGVVTSEELRRQLGDQIPGAFQTAARAMGVTTTELNKMLKSGELLSEVFIPKLALQFFTDYEQGAKIASKSAQAEINRLQNAYLEFVKVISDSGALDEFKKSLASIVSSITEWIRANDDLLRQEIPKYLNDISEAAKGIKNIFNTIKEGLDALPPGILEIGLLGVLLIGLKKHPFITTATTFLYILGKIKESLPSLLEKMDDSLKGRGAGNVDSLGGLEGALSEAKNRASELTKEIEILEGKINKEKGSFTKSFLSIYESQAENLRNKLADVNYEIESIENRIKRLPSSSQNERASIPSLSSIIFGDSDSDWQNNLAKFTLMETAAKSASEKVNKINEDALKAAKKRSEEAQKYIESLQREVDLFGASEIAIKKYDMAKKDLLPTEMKQAEALIDQIEAQKENSEAVKAVINGLKEKDKAVEDIINSLRKETEAIDQTTVALTKMKLAEEGLSETDPRWKEAIRLAQKKDDQIVEKERKELLKKQEDDYKHYLERVQDATADVFYDISKNTEDGWKGLCDRIGDYFLKLLAEMEAQAIAQPIIVPILQSLGGQVGLSSLAGSGTSGSSTGLTGQAGSLLWNTYGAKTGIGATIGSWLSTPLWTSEVSATGAGLGQGGYTSLGPTIGNLGMAYGLGSLGYSTVGNWVGLPQGEYTSYGAGIGAAGGALAGAKLGASLGSWAPGIGNIVGGIVGAILGGVGASFIGGDGNRHLTIQSNPSWAYGQDVNFPGYAGFRNRSTAGSATYDKNTNPFYGNVFGALEDSLNAMTDDIYSRVDDMIAPMPDDIEAKIKTALSGVSIDFSSGWQINSEHIQEGLTAILNTVGEAVWDKIEPLLIQGYSETIGRFVGEAASSTAFGKLSSTSNIKQFLSNSGLFNADYTMASGQDFTTYQEAANQVVAAINQVTAAWDAINTTLDQTIIPLSQVQTQVQQIQTTVDNSVNTLKALGFSEEALNEVREKGLNAIDAYLDREALTIENRLKYSLASMTMTDTEKQHLDFYLQLESSMKAIADLGPGYEYLADQAMELYNLQLDGIERNLAAQKRSNTWSLSAIQQGALGMSPDTIRLSQIGEKYNWVGTGYQNANGSFNWQALIGWVQTELPRLTVDQLETFADNLGLPLDTVISDIEFLTTTITGAFESVKTDSQAIADTWDQINTGVKNLMNSLKFSSSNPADAAERLELLNHEIIRITDLFNIATNPVGKRQEWANQLTDLYGQQMQLAQDVYQRPSQEYASLYDRTMTRLGILEYMTSGWATEYDIQVSQLTALQQIASATYGTWQSLQSLNSYDVGTPYVPSNQLAYVHKGETIIPAGKDGGGVTVNLTVNAPGGDGKGIAKEIQKVLPGIIRSNGAVRSEIRMLH